MGGGNLTIVWRPSDPRGRRFYRPSAFVNANANARRDGQRAGRLIKTTSFKRNEFADAFHWAAHRADAAGRRLRRRGDRRRAFARRQPAYHDASRRDALLGLSDQNAAAAAVHRAADPPVFVGPHFVSPVARAQLGGVRAARPDLALSSAQEAAADRLFGARPPPARPVTKPWRFAKMKRRPGATCFYLSS